MPKRSDLITIKPLDDTKDVEEMLDRNWRKRFEKFKEQLVWDSANRVSEGVVDKIPAGQFHRKYRESITVASIQGMPEGTVGYAVYSKARSRRESTIDSQRTVLYIQARRKMKRISPEVQLLVDYSPWTRDTLPFSPKKSDARIVFRKVTEREVRSVERRRKRDSRIWRRELERVGVRRKKDLAKFGRRYRNLRGVPDRIFDALRLEFGQGNVKARPHWRIAIWDLKKTGFRNMMKDRNFIRGLTDPGFKGWMRWPTKTASKISARVAKSFVPFQKKLGIKA